MSNTKKGFIAAAILLTGLALSAAVYLLVRPENTDPITFSITKEQRLKPDTVKQEQAGVQALAVQALSDESDEREIGRSGEPAISLLDQYDKFLARAEFSPQARYYLSDVLDRCLPIDVRNQQDLSALRSSGTLPADVMAYLEEKLARCYENARCIGYSVITRCLRILGSMRQQLMARRIVAMREMHGTIWPVNTRAIVTWIYLCAGCLSFFMPTSWSL